MLLAFFSGCGSINHISFNYYERGKLAQEQGYFNEAEELYISAVKYDDSMDAMVKLGDLYLNEFKNTSEAIVWYTQAAKLENRYAASQLAKLGAPIPPTDFQK